MRRLHLWTAGLAIAAFLITGMIMRFHEPPLSTLDDGLRLLYRSRHIYILAAGLINLCLGLYLQRRESGWRRTVQNIGSLSFLVSPALLVLAFAVEPGQGLQPDTRWAALGLYLLLLGGVAHVASSLGTKD